jgi:quercetin dioxygenase-like cupin family protein
MMTETSNVARHARPPELVDTPLEDIMQRYIGRFRDRVGDWNAFADAQIDGYRRAQYRFIGAGASGKHDSEGIIPPGNFTLSIMEVPSGQGNASHTHEVEEVFFVLKGKLVVFVEDETGRRLSEELGPWECICCPAGVIHGYINETDEPCFLQVMLGRGRPEVAGFADSDLHQNREQHLA